MPQYSEIGRPKKVYKPRKVNTSKPKKFEKKTSIQPKNFIEHKNKFLKVFNKFSDKLVKNLSGIKPEDIISDKYQQFINVINKPYNKNLIKTLPIILLSITVLATKNKRILKPIYDAYLLASKGFNPDTTFIGKIINIIKSYIEILTKIGGLESLEISLVTLSLFVEDIPNIFKKLEYLPNIPTVTIYKNLIKNINDVTFELVDKPELDKLARIEKYEERQELREMTEQIKKLQKQLNSK